MALLHDEQQRLVEQILSSFDGNLSKVIAQIERLLSRYILSTDLSTKNALQFDVEFDKILTQSGYYDLVNKMIDSDYDNMFALITEGFAAGGMAMQYTSADLSRVMALKALQSNQFSVVGSTAGTALKQNLFKYVLSNYTLEDMQRQLIVDFQGTNLVRHSRTLAVTSIKEFQESMIDIGADGLQGVWVYTGVRDSKNRDLCACILDNNGYFTEEQKNRLQYDPRRTFNCRHRFRMVSEDYAKETGYSKMSGSSC